MRVKALLVSLLILSLSGCVTRYVTTDTQPPVKKLSKETVKWVKENKAPDVVVNDLVNCGTTTKIVEENRQDKTLYELYLGPAWAWIAGGVLSVYAAAKVSLLGLF